MKFLRKTITLPEKEFREEVTKAEELVEELRLALAEAMEWIERPVETQEDATYFLLFETRVAALLGE